MFVINLSAGEAGLWNKDMSEPSMTVERTVAPRYGFDIMNNENIELQSVSVATSTGRSLDIIGAWIGMNRILTGSFLWMAVVLSAFGGSTVIAVAPIDRDGVGQFKFAVTNSTVSNGLSFHVVITPQSGSMPTDSRGYLCVANITGDTKRIGPMTPETQVAFKTGKRALIADFVASKKLLSDPDACFAFVVSEHRGPSADFYVLKLSDFAKR